MSLKVLAGIAVRDENGPASPGQAWLRAIAARHGGDLALARLWLDRALRLAPEDPRISFELANLCITGQLADVAAGADIFTRLARRYDLAAAWAGLLTARRLAGNHAEAAAALAALLARHCLPEEPAFGEVAGLVTAAAGAPGWCGVTQAGVVRTGVVNQPLTFVLDGKKLPWRRDIEFAAPHGAMLAVSAGGIALLGSPLDLAALRKVEGVAEAGADGAVWGWASRPAAPALPPPLRLIDAAGRSLTVRFAGVIKADRDSPFQQRHKFKISPRRLQEMTPPFQLIATAVTGMAAEIFGSPVDPAAARIPAVSALLRGAPVTALPPRQKLCVVVPVYRHLQVTQDCFDALFAALPKTAQVIAVDDATPEPALAAWLDTLAARQRITLIRHGRNQGFPAAANAGLQAAAGCDVLLLNNDTLLPPGAIETLLEVAYSRADIGSVTPFSNEATILTYPDTQGGNPAPDLAQTVRLNQLAVQANGAAWVEIPTGVGFCMLLRHDCLAATGTFRAEIFAQGYGEENDWCLRARQRGYTHAAATGAYVAHLGGVSFRGAGLALNQRNARRLNVLYPGYHAMIMRAIRAGRLAPARRRLDEARFAGEQNTGGAVLLISHNHGGGVARRIAVEMAAIRAAGQRPMLLFPSFPANPKATPFPWDSQITDDDTGKFPNLRYRLPDELPALLRLLRAQNVRRVELHHALGHHPVVRELASRLGVPQDIVIHDYASFCLRVNLLTRSEPAAPLRYCGEPNLAGCEACIAANGDETFERLGVTQNLHRSAAEFAAARRITTPSADAAQRMTRHFPGIRPEVTPWEDDAAPVRLRAPGTAARRKIVVIGGIGPAKGFDILVGCAQDAVSRDLPLDFIVAGASAEDEKLFATGRIFVTGAYREQDATALITSLNADLAFLPSIWPETWCFTLGEAWRAGLYTVAFDLGAQGARIRATNRGGLLPLGLPIARINDALLAWQPNLRNSHPADNVTS